jgi:hypothetical protein
LMATIFLKDTHRYQTSSEAWNMRLDAMMLFVTILVTSIATTCRPAYSFGDYPIASCKSWNGTIRKVKGIDSRHAVMTGVVTDDDILEYCERDPGGETKQYGGKLTVNQCVRKYRSEMKEDRVRSIADCQRGTIIFQGIYGTSSAQFPLAAGSDESCASGMPPLMAQFRILCPMNAARWNIV